MPLTVFTRMNFVADFLQAKCDFRGKTAVFRFWAPFGRLRGNVRWSSYRLIGKRVGHFLLLLFELFSLGITAEALLGIICSKSAISLQRGPVDPKFRIEGVAPTNHSPSLKTRINNLSYGKKSKDIFLPSCHNARVWQTDWRTYQTDRQNSHRKTASALHAAR